MGNAVEEFLKHIESEIEHPEPVRKRLEKDIVPVVGNTWLSAVTAGDISGTSQKIVDGGSPVSANSGAGTRFPKADRHELLDAI